MENIGVVIVTYNRVEKLKETLALFDKQTCRMNYVLVVNNASTDGTGDFLDVWIKEPTEYEKEVRTMPYNTGGSGGFFAGLEEAQEKTADWIWVSDDDAFPETEALEKAQAYLESVDKPEETVAAICGMVINNGKIDLLHRRTMSQRGLKIKEDVYSEKEYKKKSFEINCFSYVGTIINKNKLKIAGLPEKEYFIWMDDTEHSLRLSKTGKILCVPEIKVHHDVENDKVDFTWKTYYGVRNFADLCRRHFSPSLYEWHCFYMIFKTYIKDILRIHRTKNRMIRCAIDDARKGRLGLHNIYRPGWKPEKV